MNQRHEDRATPEVDGTLGERLEAKLATLEARYVQRITELERAVAALHGRLAPPAVRDAPPAVAVGPPRRALARWRRAPAGARPATPAAAAKTSRRGMLGTAAKIAVATAAAGVLVEQVGTRTALASPGGFTSNVSGTPAVSAVGTSGADGVDASSDTGFGVFGQSAGASGIGILGKNTSNNISSIAILGISDNGSGGPGPGIGVQGEGRIGVQGQGGTGVEGTSSSGSGVGVYATGTNGADGLDASSDTGRAIYALSTSGNGVYAFSYSAPGIYGETAGVDSFGVQGLNVSNASGSVAVYGESQDGSGNLGPGIGVLANSGSGYGVVANSNTGVGVSGGSDTGVGVLGGSNLSTGVLGTTSNPYGSPTAYGVKGVNNSNIAGTIAVLGHSDNGSGGLGPGIGVQGETASGQGVRGTATTGVGVYGTTAGGASTQAIYGVGTSGATGLRASSDTGNALVALSTSGTGLNVQSSTGSAVVATSNGVGYGLYLTAPSGWAIGCVGRLRVIGAAVGTVTLAHGTTSKYVPSSACSGASQVILTPTSDPLVRIWAVAAPGAFTIHGNPAPGGDVTFSYFLIN